MVTQDVKVRNDLNGKYQFEVFRKDAITNVQVKPNSSHDPKVLCGIFKGFIHRAYRICSEAYLDKEVEFLVRVFKENGYDELTLRKLAEEVKNKVTSPAEPTQADDNTETLKTIMLPWIPLVSPRLKKVFRKAGFKVVFKANRNLQSILSKKNKVKLPPNSYPGVYKIPCPCGVPPYVGKTKLKVNKRTGQHEEYVAKEQWNRSGAASHAQTCPLGPSFEEAETIATENRHFERSVREALEIQRHRSGPKYGGMNLDEGQYLNTTFWMPYMDWITKEENERLRKRSRGHVTSSLHLTSNDEDTALNEDTALSEDR